MVWGPKLSKSTPELPPLGNGSRPGSAARALGHSGSATSPLWARPESAARVLGISNRPDSAAKLRSGRVRFDDASGADQHRLGNTAAPPLPQEATWNAASPNSTTRSSSSRPGSAARGGSAVRSGRTEQASDEGGAALSLNCGGFTGAAGPLSALRRRWASNNADREAMAQTWATQLQGGEKEKDSSALLLLPKRRAQHKRRAANSKAPRSLDCSVQIEHPAVTRVCVSLVASLRKAKVLDSAKLAEGLGDADVPRCSIKVWAESGDETPDLAYCVGYLCLRTSCTRLHVEWLGRRKTCPGQSDSSDWRYVRCTEEGAQERSRRVSVAQAVLGVLVAVAQLFACRSVDLDAQDSGSGKLIRYYESMGFKNYGVLPGEKKDPYMEGPADAIAAYAPADWLQGILPKTFDAWRWLWQDVEDRTLDVILSSMGIVRLWTWKAAWPVNADVEVNLHLARDSKRLEFQATMTNPHGTELASARCVVRLRPSRSLRVMWLGRRGARQVHESVRGFRVYGCSAAVPEEADSAAGDRSERVTVAVALLGVLAVMGRWFGVDKAELLADDRSGKLVAYLSQYSFVQQAEIAPGDPCSMVGSCTELAARCCPSEWRANLPPEAELGMLHLIVQ